MMPPIQEPRPPEGPQPQKADAAPAGFGLRWLMLGFLVLAIVFAVISAVLRHWPTEKLLFLLALIVGWISLTGLAVYAMLFRRRAIAHKYGRLMFRIEGPWCFRGAQRYLLPIGLTILSCMVVLALCMIVDETWRDTGIRISGWEVAFLAVIYMNTCTIAMPYAARTGRLEIRKRGINGIFAPSGWLWKDVISSSWSKQQKYTVVAILGSIGDFATLTIEVPAEKTAEVDELFRQALGDRHTGL